ncbi:MAG: cytochrome-c peroxidase [Acidobacteria bacterium]|nr:cytochrome-c peroxidase [Acidobacteriota bacterium]
MKENLLFATPVLAIALLALALGQDRRAFDIPLGLDIYRPVPEDNPLTPRKVALGRRLFFDRRLSRDHSLACADCHSPDHAFTDGKVFSVGVFGRKGSRNVPTLINRGYGIAFFWDGRSSTLEDQVLRPIQDTSEMDLSLDDLVVRLKQDREYRLQFASVFGKEINSQDVARALASFVRSILSGDSAYDRYVNGVEAALSAEAQEGLKIFRGKGRCTACHIGPNLTDEAFHNTGIAWKGGRLADLGRFAVTERDSDLGAFKTPTLREVSRTAPYMHDGSLPTLEDVVEHYNRGGNRNPHLDPDIQPLNLTMKEKNALISFLKSLTGSVTPTLPFRRKMEN